MDRETLRVTVHIDGGARGNPGPAGAGVVVTDPDSKTVLREAGWFLGRATNNVAEYRALLAGLKAAAALGATEVEVLSDSELIVRQMNGQYRVRNAGLQPLYGSAQELAAGFKRCSFSHIRREHNRQADRLVNQAITQRRNVEDAEATA